ncbi:MAG TPA: lantibiotic dehydratase, partial [Holophagaceae bacterium]|nr:lantibiotic dehydratase [Holophagaceae bacterium]
MPEQPPIPRLDHQGFFAFRTPALPFADLFMEAGADAGAQRGRLLELVARSEVRDALFLASPDLCEALEHWRQDPEGEKGQRAERSLMRYLSRMAARPTPFGLFAGCSVGRIGEATCLSVAPRQEYIRHTRLDNDYLSLLCDAVVKDAELREGLRFRPNSSLYEAAGRLRYAESRLQEKTRAYHLVAVEDSPYLREILIRAEGGASPEDLAMALVDGEITLEEGRAFVGELIDSQILVPDLSPAVTGSEPVHDLLAQLRAHPRLARPAEILAEAQRSLESMDGAGPGADPARYLEIADVLRALPAKVELSRLFQVDMAKPAPQAILGEAVVDEIRRAAALLHGLARVRSEDPLSRFRQAFTARYEGREMPLAQVLDEEIGIGLGLSGPGGESAPLLLGLPFQGPEADGTVPWGPLDQLLLAKLQDSARRGDRVLDLDPEGLKPLLESPKAKPLPKAIAFVGSLSAESPAALAQGDFKLLVGGFSGPSGANLLGRFCHADPQLLEGVRAHLDAEQAHCPDAVHAEIVHLPEGRIGNVLLRPLLRDFEIPLLGRSGAPEDRQISLSDLAVTVSGDRVVLRSRRLGKEVLPRLSTAHNFSFRSLDVYRFLCLLQSQQQAGGLAWSWGALEALDFLPRVTCGRLVLSRARWRFVKKDVEILQKAGDRAACLAAWREERGLPRFLLLQDGDNELPLDLDSRLSVENFLEFIRKREALVLVELYPAPAELCAEGPEGRFTHELVVPLVQAMERPVPAAGPAPSTAVERAFPPGSEWLYLKLYTGSATADQLLREVIAPLAARGQAEGVVDRWFYIRYGDPDWHLRLRFHGDPVALHEKLWPHLRAALPPLLAQGMAWRLQSDTYEREVERYGGPEGIALSEAWFHADSRLCLDLLARLPGDAGMEG